MAATIIIIILGVSQIVLLYNIYLLYRNNQVYKFRKMIINKGTHEFWDDEIYDMYSYNKMLYSFKPLKLEAWFTAEQIEKYFK